MNPIKLKQFLAQDMAKIDSLNYVDYNSDYQYHYEKLLSWRDFDLLSYWLEYNGIFEGGEDLLQHLNIK